MSENEAVRVPHVVSLDVARDAAKIYTGSLASQALGSLKGLAVARLLGPTDFGFWKAIELILQYHQFTTLGTQNGMSREIAIWRGRGSPERVQRVLDTAFTQVFTLPTLASLGVVLAASWVREPLLAFSLRLAGAIALAQMLQVLWERMIYAHRLFGLARRLMVINAVLSFAVTLLLVYFFGIRGQLLALLIVALVMFGAARSSTTLRARLVLDWGQTAALIRVGFPIMAVGFVYLLLATVDRMLILRFLDLAALGRYGLALMALQLLSAVPAAVGDVLYPRLNETYGSTGRPETLRLLAVDPILALAPLLAIMIAGLVLFVEDAVGTLLPAYGAAAVLPIQILAAGGCLPEINILNTIDRQKLYLAVQVAALGLNVGLSLVLLRVGWGLAAVATGAAVSFLAYRTATSWISLRFMQVSTAERWRVLGRTIGPVLYALVGAALAGRLVAGWSGWHRVGAEVVAFLVVCAPLAVILRQRWQLVSEPGARAS